MRELILKFLHKTKVICFIPTSTIILFVLTPFMLTGCDSLGSRKVKSLVELTPKLTVETKDPIIVEKNLKEYNFDQSILKEKSFTLSKNTIIAEPIFAKGIVYSLDSKGFVSAFSKKNKENLWSHNTNQRSVDNNHFSGGLAYNSDKLYVTNGSRFLIVLDSSNGHELVRKEFSDIIRIAPVVLNDHTILVQTVSNQLFAYDTLTASVVWQHEGLFETLSSSYHVKPIVYNSNVIVNYSSGQIFSLNLNSGEEKWGLNLSDQESVGIPSFEAVTISCTPIVEDNFLYIASSTGKIIKLTLDTGLVIWEVNAYDVQSMSLNGNNIFVTNNARQIAAIDTSNGKVKWASDLDLNNDKRKSKAVHFLTPFITASHQSWKLNVISNNGEIYSFQADASGNLNSVPILIKVPKDIEYSGFTCCGEMYIVSGRSIKFIE